MEDIAAGKRGEIDLRHDVLGRDPGRHFRIAARIVLQPAIGIGHLHAEAGLDEIVAPRRRIGRAMAGQEAAGRRAGRIDDGVVRPGGRAAQRQQQRSAEQAQIGGHGGDAFNILSGRRHSRRGYDFPTLSRAIFKAVAIRTKWVRP